MSFISRAELSEYATSYERRVHASVRKSDTRSAATTDVFLSHSHLDADLVEATVNFFASQGVTVYVDWMDNGMPSATSPETAERIKAYILRNKKFVMLASANSLSSRWVPWELGFADSAKGLASMAVMPVRDYRGYFPGNEYVDLYPTIHSLESGEWGVVPAGSNRGTPLRQWLSS